MSLPLIQPSLDSAIYLHKLTLDLRYKPQLEPYLLLNISDRLSTSAWFLLHFSIKHFSTVALNLSLASPALC